MERVLSALGEEVGKEAEALKGRAPTFHRDAVSGHPYSGEVREE